MRYALALFLTALSTFAEAPNRRPQLTWEGYVRGGAVLYIHGKSVDIQGRDTGSVERPRVSLVQPLPATQQSIRLTVRRGTGRVQVEEQPDATNEFTAAVRIDGSGTKHEFFRIDFFWNPGT